MINLSYCNAILLIVSKSSRHHKIVTHEVVDRGSETQFPVGKTLSFLLHHDDHRTAFLLFTKTNIVKQRDNILSEVHVLYISDLIHILSDRLICSNGMAAILDLWQQRNN